MSGPHKAYLWMNVSSDEKAKKIVIEEILKRDDVSEYLECRADHNGWTALHYAAACGSHAEAKSFLEAGADKNIKSTKQFWYGIDDNIPAGSTAADVAKICNYPKIAALIETFGSDTVKKRKAGEEDQNNCTSSSPADGLKGKVICFSGTLNIARKEASSMAESCGAEVHSTVTKKTEIIVTGDKTGSKVTDAIQKGVTIWTEEDFLAACKVHNKEPEKKKKQKT
eukprot:m.58162 g.58162  ORF g.58162 m.58162 type:complete len:225 (-) comp11158_c0_seq1:59-733(-)